MSPVAPAPTIRRIPKALPAHTTLAIEASVEAVMDAQYGRVSIIIKDGEIFAIETTISTKECNHEQDSSNRR